MHVKHDRIKRKVGCEHEEAQWRPSGWFSYSWKKTESAKE